MQDPTVVHGDYKLDNVMFEPTPPVTPLAVLDWEQATIGDPLVDLGWLLGLPAGDWKMTGIDAEGLDLRCGGRVARLTFDGLVTNAAEARKALIALVVRARGT